MDSGAPKITLDQESFKALASDVRVGILKRLDVRRETVTDLSSLLNLSKPTLLEHLEKLQSAGLVKRVGEGRKWIYYELSDKGRKILHPERVAITLALGAAITLAAVGLFYLLFSAVGVAPIGPAVSPTSPSRSFGTPGGDPFAIVAVVVAGVLAVVAFALHSYGRDRRARFFEQLGTA